MDWISIEDKEKPPCGTQILIRATCDCCQDDFYLLGYVDCSYGQKKWMDGDTEINNGTTYVTHWSHLISPTRL